MIKNPNVVSVEVAGKLLGIGRTSAYDRARAGTMPGLLPISGRHLVSLFEIEKVLGVPTGTLTKPIGFDQQEATTDAAA